MSARPELAPNDDRRTPSSIAEISASEAMQPILELAQKAAGSRSTPPASVLITGETGTGKEVMARAIHDASPRRAEPFVAVNCSGIPETLIESELFGYGRGAFTGADRRGKPGRVEQADKGTLFLDEIGDLPLASQAKLLRFLQDHVVQRLGESAASQIDVRIIAATNKNLAKAIKKKKFRQDLYYRLNVIEIPLLPLRDRPEDIMRLAEQFRIDCAHNEQKIIKGFTGAAHEILQRHSWPGNIRELENAVHRAVIVADDKGRIGHEHLPRMDTTDTVLAETFKTLHQATLDYTHQVLQFTAGNKIKAAEILGVSRVTVHRYVDSENFPQQTQTSPFGNLRAAMAEHVQKVFESTQGNKAEAAKILDISRSTLDEYLKSAPAKPIRALKLAEFNR